LKLKLFILITLVDFAELLTDFSYTNLSNLDALDNGQTPCSLEHYLVLSNFTKMFHVTCHATGVITRQNVCGKPPL